ncbi:Deoxyguanosinetriphosphate triphosphohydrolase [Labilithrix luteola]|uniref:Deoxyguanosinetriphosphate triphosphohydrolase n=1 Tax=Labilithrix luteola TaxID=1391654 RepID=A0A0K1Q225_9BACT|nr:HD domain-containing protein [Labilithrix luteola]AKU99772.1 Deoxyguanosinetriphosphate triphosphohydrolase [Labilithrix luteola]
MILRDAVHGLVSFESEEERVVSRLMDTPEVQRLRRIRQLGVASAAFPGAEHTRFSHAIGAAHVMKLLLARLRQIHGQLPFWQQVTSDRAQDALAAAFLHDVGHGPLSHLFEDAIPGTAHHEEWTEKIVLDPSTGVNAVLSSIDPHMPERVAALVRGEHPLPYLARAVSGTLDVDRCDYLLRDAHSTGVRYGVFDLDWLFRSLRFAPSKEGAAPGLAIDGAKGLPAIEAFILARLFMFQQVYLHKATRSAEWMIRKVLSRASTVIAEGQRLAGTPRAIEMAAHGQPPSLADYLELDDAVLSVAMHAWESGPDPLLADLSRRVRSRALFKTYELFGDQALPEGRERAHEMAREVARTMGFDPDIYVGLDVATDFPFGSKKHAQKSPAVGSIPPQSTVAEAEPLTVVFAKGPARPLKDVSFILGRLAGQELSRTRLIFAPELREEITRVLGS